MGLVSFFDFVVAVDGVELRELDSTFIDKIKAARPGAAASLARGRASRASSRALWLARERARFARRPATRGRPLPSVVRGRAAALRGLQPQVAADAERDHHADAELGRPGHAGRHDPLRHVPQGGRAPRPRPRGRPRVARPDRRPPAGERLPPRHRRARLRRLGRASRRVPPVPSVRPSVRLSGFAALVRSSTTSAPCTWTSPSSSTSTTSTRTRSASSSSCRRSPGAAAVASARPSPTATSTASPRGVGAPTASPSSRTGPSPPMPATPWPSSPRPRPSRRKPRRPSRRPRSPSPEKGATVAPERPPRRARRS